MAKPRVALRKPESLMTIGGRMKAAAKEAQINQRRIAAHFGVTEQAVSQWVRDETVPEQDKIFALAKLLNVRTEWLFSGSGERYETDFRDASQIAVGQAVPVISRVQAGHWTDVVDPQDPEAPCIFVEDGAALGPNAFALEITGRSMLPEFRPSDIVIIDPAVEPNPGDFVVAKLEDRETATFKKFRPGERDSKGRTTFELVPLNPDWQTLKVGPGNRGHVVGTMVEHRQYRVGRRPRFFQVAADEE